MLTFKSFASSSKGNLNTLSDGETYIMLDCGLPWKQVQKDLNFQASRFSGICLTHQHKDHSAGIIDAMKAGQDIYLLPETREALGLAGHRIHEIDLLHQFKIGSFAVKAFPLKHDVPNCGFLFANSKGERAVYITDTPYCPYRFPPLHTIAIGVNYSMDILRGNISNGLTDRAMKTRLIRSHMSLQTLESFLVANDLSQVRKIYLLHLSDSNSDAKLFKLKVQEVTGKEVIV